MSMMKRALLPSSAASFTYPHALFKLAVLELKETQGRTGENVQPLREILPEAETRDLEASKSIWDKALEAADNWS
jgi:hypothetical protein